LLSANTGIIGGVTNVKVDFTIEELFKRMRRIEKLTKLIKEDARKQGLPADCPAEEVKVGLVGGLTADALKEL
jgi:hypothetical protein